MTPDEVGTIVPPLQLVKHLPKESRAGLSEAKLGLVLVLWDDGRMALPKFGDEEDDIL